MKNDLVWLSTILLTMTWFTGLAQGSRTVTGYLLDGDSSVALPYAHVALKNTTNGTITNEEGLFTLQYNSPTDSVVFSYIGYTSRTLSISTVQNRDRILLFPSTIDIGELTVYADGDYLYDQVYRCRNVMNAQPLDTARTYFNLETIYQDAPLEMIECYYNGSVRGANIHSLELKNGRIGWPLQTDGRFFVNLTTTKALALLDITEPSGEFPFNPLQFKPSRMKKRFELIRLPTFSDTNTLHIAFKPRQEPDRYFSGELWMAKTSGQMLKLELHINGATQHPFDPLRENSEIDQLDLNLIYNFKTLADRVVLDNVNFTYALNLDQQRTIVPIDQPFKVRANGLVYFYDYSDVFFLPLFDYDPDHTDYRKISFFPYDSVFWSNDLGLTLSTDQRDRQQFLEEEGVLLNFGTDLLVSHADSSRRFFESTNAVWTADERIHMKLGKQHDSIEAKVFEMNPEDIIPNKDKVKLTTQLFLNINTFPDDTTLHSAAIFDVFESHNFLREGPLIDCIVNIYFDLAEIERRRMQSALEELPTLSNETITEIYRKTKKDLDSVQNDFMDEIEMGSDLLALKEWNAYVKARLQIDNMALFNITASEK